jgi:hypothetical protein
MIASSRRIWFPPFLPGLVALMLLLATPLEAPAAEDAGAVTRALPPSNTTLLARASHAAARRLAAQVPIAQGVTVGLQQEGDGKLDADVREALLQALNARQIKCVLLDPVAIPGAAGAAAAPAEEAPGGAAPAANPVGSPADLAAQGKPGPAAPAESLHVAGGGAAGSATLPAVVDRGHMPILTWRVQEARVDYVRQFRSGLFGAHRIERRARADLALRLTPVGSEGVAWSASADTALGDVVLKSEISALEDRTRPETRPTLPQSSFKKVLEPVLVVVLVAGLVSLFYQNRP